MDQFSRGEQPNKQSWKDCPKLKIALIIIIPTILLLLIILLAVFIRSERSFCNTDPCLQQTNKLRQGMNFDVNPCDNVYQFVCGKVPTDTSRKNFYVELNNKTNEDLLRLYKENIKDSEHKMIKISKRLFQKCMRIDEIEKDGMRVINDVIEKIGGWPALEIPDSVYSIENVKFDWVQATYKLRELGYPFLFFINVAVNRERQTKEKFFLEITLLYHADENEIMKRYTKSEATEMMTKTVKLFGAGIENFIEGEMENVYRFWQEFPKYGYGFPEKYRVEQLQRVYDEEERVPFSWLEFLNRLLGPQMVISANDYVLVDDFQALCKWTDKILGTPNRTVGNYMIWKLIQTQLPYLPKAIQNILKYNISDTREEFCLKVTNQRFLLSPIEIINTRNLITAENQQHVQEIFSHIKSEFIKLVENTDWMDDEDKRRIIQDSRSLTLIYGLPGDYVNDKALDDMDVDLVDRKAVTFLDYLAQANRNLQTRIFKQITSSASSNTMSRPYLKFRNSLMTYYSKIENELFMPVQFAYYLQRGTPGYFEYSFIGNSFGLFISSIFVYYDFEFNVAVEGQLSQQTMNKIKQSLMCIKNQIKKYSTSGYLMDTRSILSRIIEDKTTYLAYEKWLRSNGEEKLPGLNYTSRQLFWIAGIYCNVPIETTDFSTSKTVVSYENVTLMNKLNNEYFSKDFKCSQGTEMNPVVKCPLLF